MFKFISAAIAAVALSLTAMPASAHDRGHGGRHHDRYERSYHRDYGRDWNRGHGWRNDDRWDRSWRGDYGRRTYWRAPPPRIYERDVYWRDSYRDNRYWRGDDYRWRRGDRFDRRVSHVVLRDRDYRRYGLGYPHRGQYYARTRDGDVLLVAAATSLVLWSLYG